MANSVLVHATCPSLSCPWSDRSHLDRPIRNPWSEPTRSRSGWSASNPTLMKLCRVSPTTPARSAPSPSNIFQHSRPGWYAKSGKSQENLALGNLDTRRFPKLVPICPFRVRRSKWSRPMQITPPPDHHSHCGLADRPSLIIRPDLRADPGKQTTPHSPTPIEGSERSGDPCLQCSLQRPASAFGVEFVTHHDASSWQDSNLWQSLVRPSFCLLSTCLRGVQTLPQQI